jgi:hypothetical protein
MPSAYQPLPPQPQPQVPLVDPTTNKLTPHWAQWFAALEAIVREAQSKEP